MNLVSTIRRNEKGQTAIEFGLILMLVSTALVGMLALFSGGVDGYYTELANLISTI